MRGSVRSAAARLRPPATRAVRSRRGAVAGGGSQPLPASLLRPRELSRLLKCFSLDFTLNLKLYSKAEGGGAGGRKAANLSRQAEALAACLPPARSLSQFMCSALSPAAE